MPGYLFLLRARQQCIPRFDGPRSVLAVVLRPITSRLMPDFGLDSQRFIASAPWDRVPF